MKKYIIFLLAAILFCSGCGKKLPDTDIPQLIEPASVNASYRPAEYGTVGKLEVLPGTVVPEDYCHYYGTNVMVSEILVEVGDIVEVGDVLAYADVESAREALADYRKQLSYENASYALNQQLSQVKQEYLVYQKTQTDEILQLNYDTQIAIEQENAHYDAMLHEYRIKKLQESITSQQILIENGTLTARHSGQVTYTKNIAKGREAGANENIVVVSDLADIHIELMDTNIVEYKFSEYEVKYMIIAGEKIPVTEQEYSTEEMILSKVSQHFPNVRFQCPEGCTMTIGDMYPVYFQEKEMQNVLIVGNDSLYTEGEEHYVYIKNDSGEQEKRFIEIGVSDKNYTQVTEGLAEGELVYYHSTAKIPSEYAEYTVTLSDFEIANHGIKYGRSDANIFPCLSDYEGELTEVAVSKEQEVAEGDLLYIIDTGEGKAAMAEAQNAIDQENASFRQNLASINEQIETANALAEADGNMSCELQMLNIQKEILSLTHDDTLEKLQKNYNRISSGNDGNGKVSVYATVSGTVSKVDFHAGDKVEKENQILQISTRSADILLVQMQPEENTAVYQENIADVGETVTIKKKDILYEGSCIGWAAGNNNLDKGYVYTDEQGKVHLSYSESSGYEYPAFYVKMKDNAFFEDTRKGDSVNFTYVSMHNVIVLPEDMVYSEPDPLRANTIYHYVWRVTDGELIKQYVFVDESWKDGGKQVILSGVSPGEVLAQE